MNYSDLIILGIILVFGIIGLFNGFIYSIFRLASFFISVIISVKFYPVVADIMMKTALAENIKGSILKNLLQQKNVLTIEADAQVKKAAADTVINRLPLPDFLKKTLEDQIPDASKLLDINQIMDSISSQLTLIVISVISLIMLYILVRIGLIFLRFILQGIAKLPIFKQMDKIGGFALGALEGLLTIYIICALLMLFNASPQFRQVFESIDNSVFAKFFYQNNFILDMMFPKGTMI